MNFESLITWYIVIPNHFPSSVTRSPFQSFGRSPSPEQLKASGSGGSCPICYDDYRSPTLLHCKHIFCEECLVSQWNFTSYQS